MFPSLSERPQTRRAWRSAVSRAVATVHAFATLADPGGDAQRLASHPHRRPLASRQGPRRPGSVAPRGQACTSPVAPRG